MGLLAPRFRVRGSAMKSAILFFVLDRWTKCHIFFFSFKMPKKNCAPSARSQSNLQPYRHACYLWSGSCEWSFYILLAHMSYLFAALLVRTGPQLCFHEKKVPLAKMLRLYLNSDAWEQAPLNEQPTSSSNTSFHCVTGYWCKHTSDFRTFGVQTDQCI